MFDMIVNLDKLLQVGMYIPPTLDVVVSLVFNQQKWTHVQGLDNDIPASSKKQAT